MNKKYMNAGKLEGKGSYGIVYSFPRLPFKKKYNFYDNNTLNYKNIETIENILNNNEVSKIFYLNKNNSSNINYYNEKNNYEIILKWNLPDIFFNKPLNYGIINHELINSHPNIYNLNWCEGDFYFKYAENQITFKHGKEIKNDELDIFYKKFINLINCINFLNENNIIFDDLKIDNILDIEDTYKLSDFSSLIKVNDINKKNFNQLLFYSSYYFIYLPYLNKLLKYAIYKKTIKNTNFNKILKELENDVNNTNCNQYIKYFNKMIINITHFIKNYEEHKKNKLYVKIKYKFKKNINVKNNTKNNLQNNLQNNKSQYIKLNVNNILNELYNSKFNSTNNEIFCKIILDYYNNDQIILNLINRMNIYSLGIIVLSKLNFDISHKNRININIFLKLLQLVLLCCLNYIIIDNNIYIFEPNIENILKYYHK